MAEIFMSVMLFFKKDDTVLLFQRNKKGCIGDGFYGLPGGGIERDETVLEAACREGKEELNIDIYPQDLIVRHVLHLKNPESERVPVLVVFFVQVFRWDGEPKNCEEHNHSKLGWFKLDNLPDNTMQSNVHVLKMIECNCIYSEFEEGCAKLCQIATYGKSANLS